MASQGDSSRTHPRRAWGAHAETAFYIVYAVLLIGLGAPLWLIAFAFGLGPLDAWLFATALWIALTVAAALVWRHGFRRALSHVGDATLSSRRTWAWPVMGTLVVGIVVVGALFALILDATTGFRVYNLSDFEGFGLFGVMAVAGWWLPHMIWWAIGPIRNRNDSELGQEFL